MKARRTHSITVFAMLALLVTLLLLPATTAAGNDNPNVLPPNAHPAGHSYAEWSAQWWAWVLEQPAVVNPLFSEDCSLAQNGHVWFLTGTISGSVTRTCTVPTGKFLYLPVVNFVFVATPGVGTSPPDENIYRDGIPVVNDAMSTVHDVSMTIDGRPVTDLWNYEVMSPGFKVALPAGNVFGLTPKGYDAIAKGIQVMLTPLPPGRHTIHTHAYMGADLIDVTYNLTVSSH